MLLVFPCWFSSADPSHYSWNEEGSWSVLSVHVLVRIWKVRPKDASLSCLAQLLPWTVWMQCEKHVPTLYQDTWQINMAAKFDPEMQFQGTRGYHPGSRQCGCAMLLSAASLTFVTPASWWEFFFLFICFQDLGQMSFSFMAPFFIGVFFTPQTVGTDLN